MDKGIFAFGQNTGLRNMSNIVSNLGVVASDVSNAGNRNRTGHAGAGYG